MSRLVLALLALIACESAAQDKAAIPRSAPPQFVVVAAIDPANDLLILRSAVAVPKTVIQQEERLVGGKTVKVEVAVTVYEIQAVEFKSPLTKFQPMEASGKILKDWSKVKAGQLVLQAQDTPNVDPAYRKLLAPETIIIVPRPTEVRKVKKE
jgi:hypothetical protein